MKKKREYPPRDTHCTLNEILVLIVYGARCFTVLINMQIKAQACISLNNCTLMFKESFFPIK